MAATFQLDVLAASVPFFRGKCVSAVLPTDDGEYGVLAGHCNTVGAVCAGELRFETAEGDGFSGHSDTYLRVEAPGEKLRGSINQVRITGVDGELLTGEIID